MSDARDEAHGPRTRLRSVDILVLEAETDVAARIRQGLGVLANRVDVVTDPDEALQMLTQRTRDRADAGEPYELVVLDADLLGEECWGVVEELRRRGYEQAEIVVVAEDPDWEQLERAQAAGASRFEQTPIDLEALAQMIATLYGLDLHVVRTEVPAVHDEEDEDEPGGRGRFRR